MNIEKYAQYSWWARREAVNADFGFCYCFPIYENHIAHSDEDASSLRFGEQDNANFSKNWVENFIA